MESYPTRERNVSYARELRHPIPVATAAGMGFKRISGNLLQFKDRAPLFLTSENCVQEIALTIWRPTSVSSVIYFWPVLLLFL